MSRTPFPSTVPFHDIPFPPQGLLGSDSPASSVLWNAPTPDRSSRRASFPSLAGTIHARVLRSFRRHGRRRKAGGFAHAPLSPVRLFSNGNDRASQVPGEPLCACPVLRPRRDLHTRPLRRVDTAFRFWNSVGSRNSLLSRLNSTAHTPAVYASQDGLLHHHARLASSCWPGFAGQDPSSCKVPTKGFNRVSPHRIPLSQAFLDAIQTKPPAGRSGRIPEIRNPLPAPYLRHAAVRFGVARTTCPPANEPKLDPVLEPFPTRSDGPQGPHDAHRHRGGRQDACATRAGPWGRTHDWGLGRMKGRRHGGTEGQAVGISRLEIGD